MYTHIIYMNEHTDASSHSCTNIAHKQMQTHTPISLFHRVFSCANHGFQLLLYLLLDEHC